MRASVVAPKQFLEILLLRTTNKNIRFDNVTFSLAPVYYG